MDLKIKFPYAEAGLPEGCEDMLKHMKEAELKSFSAVVNSFYELELEPAYADYYRNALGKRAWHIGPLSLCNEDKASRGKQTSIDGNECLKWLNSKKPNFVVYICFGSVSNFNSDQLMEIAMGIEALGQDFIWVVRKDKKYEDGNKEGISTARVSMVTWPVFADQFYNEKLVTEVLKIGVSVGVQQWTRLVGDFVKREAIESERDNGWRQGRGDEEQSQSTR
ncbi:hypothetical protein EZV62_011259 [Acer yangbiense]|uniref:Uncharacterized protein n=1 Tax=Acer yangbiense TaxID=1000413 RepID=A0A5C7I564_9ROSI|nr:hypothetical protein EZV62_011259 [Acer yangbiense]